jgi:small-conductance mechanosensitive channel
LGAVGTLSDLRKVESLFLLTVIGHSQVLSDPAPEVFFEDFADSALTVSLVYWVELDNDVAPRRIASDLRFDIYERLDAAGIEIPFPQHDMHVKFAEPLPAATRLGAVHAG